MSNETDVVKVVDRINDKMPAGTWPVWPSGWEGDTEAALLDSVFSVRARYGGENTGVRAVVKNWRLDRGADRNDLRALAEFVGQEEQLFTILKNRQRLGSGPSKAAAAASAASALVGAGVRSSGDLTGSDAQRKAWCSVNGLGEVTWSYFQMLLGVQGVKADVMVTRFVADALGRKTVTPQQARDLVLGAAERMNVEATDLDYAIWSWQRKQPRKATQDSGVLVHD